MFSQLKPGNCSVRASKIRAKFIAATRVSASFFSGTGLSNVLIIYLHLMKSIDVSVDVIISNINPNKSHIQLMLLLSILLSKMTEISHKISCGFVAIFLTTATATMVGKKTKRNAFLIEDSPSKKAKSEKEIIYRRKDKTYTRSDVSKMTLETIHGISDRQCNCKFYVDPEHKKTFYSGGVERVYEPHYLICRRYTELNIDINNHINNHINVNNHIYINKYIHSF
jgi:hypothetical protein